MANTVMYRESNKDNKLLIVRAGAMACFDLKNLTSIGRRTEKNQVDIDFPETFVSRLHGEFMCNYGICTYTDKNSRNGTYHNGRKMFPDRPIQLRNGDVLHICNGVPASGADAIVMVYITDYPDRITPAVVMLDNQISEIRIGRSASQGVNVQSAAVSDDHASFFFNGVGWAVADHNSTNGVFVNNTRVTQPVYLRIGDCVRIANLHFIYLGDRIIYQMPPARQSGTYKNAPLEIHIEKRVVRKLFHVKPLLRDINVTFNSGEMILILGGSGAGKTTFMNAVLGYEKADGQITYDDINIYQNYDVLKSKISFVPQKDLMRDYDTVYYTLKNAAEMKLPDHLSKQEIEIKVRETLRLFKLDNRDNALIKALSGGERKRVSVAMEYIADPQVFFLDEPDSGIDGAYSIELMHIMRQIADTGKIVVIVSHSPNRIADNFNKVLVLAKSQKDLCGYVAFFGAVTDAYRFFDTNDLESIVGKINSEPDFYIDKFKKSIM